MNPVVVRFRLLMAITLPLLLLGTAFRAPQSAGAVGCGDTPALAAPAVQSQERWRYTYEGAGSYELVGSNPTEAVMFVNAPGCALARIALVGLDLLGNGELWSVTSDQWEGQATDAATDGDLAFLVTTSAVYAFDETTGQQLWSYGHGYEGYPEIVGIVDNIILLASDNSLTGIGLGTGAMVWQQMLPVGSVSEWEQISGGPLVALGRPDTAGQDVQAFGIDPATGMLVWQTPVGSTIASTGGTLELTGNGTDLVVAQIFTDGTSALVAVDGATGTIRWSTDLDPGDGYGRVYITRGAQPAVIYGTGSALDVKSATGFDAATGAFRWQNQNIGADALLADDTHLTGAGPTLSYLNALVSVDGETGDMIWSQPYALVDGSIAGSGQVSNGELVFTPSIQEEVAPTILGVDVASGNVDWSIAYPEFASLSFDGFAAGLALATGSTDTEAILVAIAP